jgi:heme-degrading monooxygenase HmoA
MHARLTNYSVPADRLDDFIEAFERRSDEPQETQPSDAFLLVDRGAATAVSISLWESEDAMKRGGELGEESRQRVLDATGARVSSKDTLEVAMHLREQQPTHR